LNANGLDFQRSLTIGHHFFITASCSVTSIGNFSIRMAASNKAVLARRQSRRTLSEATLRR
jgi:hypothetical protein